MSGKTGIQWTDETKNVASGCSRVHKPNGQSGCDNCYAFTWHDRIFAQVRKGQRPHAPAQYRVPFSATYHQQGVQLLPERLKELLRLRAPRKIFLGSMTDMFHETIPDSYLEQVFGVLAATPHLTYQILTKRPERMRDFITSHTHEACVAAMIAAGIDQGMPKRAYHNYIERVGAGWPWPLPNVWLGTSVEDQQAADLRIPLLLQTPATVRFLSCEPLLGPVDLRDVHYDDMVAINALTGEYGFPTPHAESGRRIHWVIIGGESGKHARAMNPAWAESLVSQCREAGVAVFVKQLGSELAYLFSLKDRHGGDVSEWPPDFPKLRVREFPQTARGQEP